MPEMLEVEAYRVLAEKSLGRAIEAIVADDLWYLKRQTTPESLRDALIGARFTAARRIGKLLLLDVDSGHVLGLRFGMTGRLLVDGAAGVDHLEYSSMREFEGWDRFGVRFADGGDLRVRDPRRLGGAELDPDEGRLGPDARALKPAELKRLLAASEAPLKARLMDQGRVAGLGNLLVDETLWRAGLDPARPAGSLADNELRRLHRHLTGTVEQLFERGGSHMGDLHLARRPDGVCPKDGTPLERRTVGGRTTYSCPRHQR
jgi:formamidopyrimidine-DNA glycosylase